MRERLRRDVDGTFGLAVILEKARNRHEHKVVLALAECGPFFRQHSDDCVRVSAHANDFADRRFVWKQPFLYDLSHNDDAPRKLDIFIIQIAAVTERVRVGSKKTSIRPNDEKARRRLNPVVNRLAFYFITKTLEANLARLAFHQPIIMNRLFVRNIVAVPKFFLHIAARTDIGWVFGKLENIRPEKANAVLN